MKGLASLGDNALVSVIQAVCKASKVCLVYHTTPDGELTGAGPRGRCLRRCHCARGPHHCPGPPEHEHWIQSLQGVLRHTAGRLRVPRRHSVERPLSLAQAGASAPSAKRQEAAQGRSLLGHPRRHLVCARVKCRLQKAHLLQVRRTWGSPMAATHGLTRTSDQALH